MREYEFTFIVQPEIGEQGLETVQERFERTLEQKGAKKLFYEDWGRRRLAYEIQNFQKGHYMVLHYLDDGGANSEIERVARLDDSVLRFLTVLADDAVEDVDARVAQAVDLEQERIRKAQERAEREAEEDAARAAEAESRAAHAASANAAASASDVAPAEGDAPTQGDTATEGDAPAEPAAQAAAPEPSAEVESPPAEEEAPAAPEAESEVAAEEESAAPPAEQPS